MKKIGFAGLVFSFFLVFSHFCYAADNVWELDKGHSDTTFRIDHVVGKVSGGFDEFDAKVDYDPAKPEEASFQFEIKVGSIDTNIGKRDKHLLSADFFDEDKYPAMTFTSKSVKNEGEGRLHVDGTFNIKGKNYDLTLPVQFLGIKDHPMKKGYKVAGFIIETTLDRLVYGVGDGGYYEKGIIGKDVDVFISIEVLRK